MYAPDPKDIMEQAAELYQGPFNLLFIVTEVAGPKDIRNLEVGMNGGRQFRAQISSEEMTKILQENGTTLSEALKADGYVPREENGIRKEKDKIWARYINPSEEGRRFRCPPMRTLSKKVPTRLWAGSAPRSPAPTAADTSAMSSMTARPRPACDTALTRPPWTLKKRRIHNKGLPVLLSLAGYNLTYFSTSLKAQSEFCKIVDVVSRKICFLVV